MKSSAARLATAAALVAGAQALPKITRTGRYLYDDSGNRFSIKGVGYQPQGSGSTGSFHEPTSFIDPLSSGANCTRDIPYLKQLGVNTVRVYSVNSSANHDDCMKALSGANIYTILDLSTPASSISRDTPAWSVDLLNTYLTTIQAFSGYDNVLAYNVGNEVVLAANTTFIAPFLKAAARDTKAYLKSVGSSALVGYAAVDGDSTWADPLASFLSCDQDATSLDLYGINNYRWVGNSSFDTAYAGIHGDFAGLTIPAYFSEYGKAPEGQPRVWQEVGSLFSSQMSDVFSGGVAFNYFPAQADDGQFGMVTISSDGNSVTTSADFTNLVTAYGSASAPTTPSKSDAGSASFPSCPGQNTTFLASSQLPPTPQASACSCIANASPCQYKPKTTNQTQVLDYAGALIDQTCGYLGKAGLNCNDIGANGTTGTYGNLSACDAQTKVSYLFGLYYQSQKQNAQACDFAGNATVNTGAAQAFPSGPASSCVASATGTAVPTLASATSTSKPASSTQKSGGGSNGGGSSGSGNGAAAAGPSLTMGFAAALLAGAAGIVTLA